MSQNKFCIHCKNFLKIKLINMGMMPIANDYNLSKKKYLLKVMFCTKCYLIQNTARVNHKKIFLNYFYKSKYSSIWQTHCRKMKLDLKKFNLNTANILEIGCNDLTLAKILKSKKNKYLGIEPAKNIIRENKKNNKFKNNLICDFFNQKLARKLTNEGYKFDIVIGTNVIAHIQNINDFIKGLSIIINDNTVGIFEFQYIGDMIRGNLYDTIYHEHYYYHSITSLSIILKKFNLEIFKIKKVKIHSGSLRIYIKKNYNLTNTKIKNFIKFEKKEGIINPKIIKKFGTNALKHKTKLVRLITTKLKNQLICGYGAAAKGNTLINFCKFNNKHIKYIFDKNKLKQKKIFPGTNIKILSPNNIKKINPDYILILAWNIYKEVVMEIRKKKIRSKLIIPYPNIKIIN